MTLPRTGSRLEGGEGFVPVFHLPHATRLRLLGLLLVGVTLGVIASIQRTVVVDEALLKSVQNASPSGFDDVAWFFNVFLRNTMIPLLWSATVLGLLALRRNDYAALFALTATVGFFTNFLKQVVDRPRPAGDFSIVQFPTDPSFPSGHVMTAMAFFGLWFILSSRLLPSWAVWPVRAVCVAAVGLTGVSRIWAGAHWPSDVLGALVWGSLFLTLVLLTHPACTRLNPSSKAEETPA